MRLSRRISFRASKSYVFLLPFFSPSVLAIRCRRFSRVGNLFLFPFLTTHTYNKHINSKFFEHSVYFTSLSHAPPVIWPTLRLSFLYSGGVKRLGELNICIETRLHRSCDGLLAWKQLRAGNEDQSRVYA